MLRILAAATTILALAATAAQADSAAQRAITVPYGDLNLSHAEDARTLAGRLEAAAQMVCIDGDADTALGQIARATALDRQACIRSAIDAAMARIEGNMDKAVRANFVSDRHAPDER